MNGSEEELRYHLVLVSKYRRKVFTSLKTEVEEAVRAAAKGSAFKIEDVAVEGGDHVHVLVRTTGTYSVSAMVNRLKAVTTNSLWRDYSSVLARYYWGGKHRLWSGGYYAATVGEASLETVKAYLDKERD